MEKSVLEKRIKERLQTKPILLCSHSVLGYPALEENPKAIADFCQAGVDIMELQFPFSDPMADGPILLEANQKAVKNGVTVDQCFEVSREVIAKNPQTMFLIMTYYNIVYKRGLSKFAKEAKEAGVLGVIIPDLPLEELSAWERACKEHQLSPILMVTPDTSDKRMQEILKRAMGFIYCVARKGITGEQSQFGAEFYAYLERVAEHTDLSKGVGFGVRSKEDVSKLIGHAQIAIVCSKAIDILGKKGSLAASKFLKGLR